LSKQLFKGVSLPLSLPGKGLAPADGGGDARMLFLIIARQLMKKAGLSLVKSLSVIGFFEMKEFIVKMMTHFMQKSPEECPEGNHFAPLCRAHPDR
jgi:hypothetical protein